MYSKKEMEKAIEDFSLHTLEYNKKSNELSFSIMTQIKGSTYLKQDFKINFFNTKKVSLSQAILSTFRLHEKRILANIATAREQVDQ